jgi:hypothetical protein
MCNIMTMLWLSCGELRADGTPPLVAPGKTGLPFTIKVDVTRKARSVIYSIRVNRYPARKRRFLKEKYPSSFMFGCKDK